MVHVPPTFRSVRSRDRGFGDAAEEHRRIRQLYHRYVFGKVNGAGDSERSVCWSMFASLQLQKLRPVGSPIWLPAGVLLSAPIFATRRATLIGCTSGILCWPVRQPVC
jgi:hypothetical protein